MITPAAVKAAKFDYTYLGKSPAELARQYGFPLENLEYEIEEKGWERRLEPTTMPDTKDMQQFADQLEKLTRSKLSIISMFRQIDNQALYAEIEKEILAKLLDLTMSLDTLDDKMANKLKTVATTLASIQEREPINLADSFKEALKDQNGAGQVVVNIANMVQ